MYRQNKEGQPSPEEIKEKITMEIQFWLSYKMINEKIDRKKNPVAFSESLKDMEKAQKRIDDLVKSYPQYSNLQKEMITEHEEQLKNIKNQYLDKDFMTVEQKEKLGEEEEEEEEIIRKANRRYDGPGAWDN